MKRRAARAKIIVVLLGTLKIVEVGFQVADKQRRLAGGGYDGGVFRVESQLDVVRWCMHVVDRLRRIGEINPPCSTTAACIDEITWVSGRTLRTSDP